MGSTSWSSAPCSSSRCDSGAVRMSWVTGTIATRMTIAIPGRGDASPMPVPAQVCDPVRGMTIETNTARTSIHRGAGLCAMRALPCAVSRCACQSLVSGLVPAKVQASGLVRSVEWPDRGDCIRMVHRRGIRAALHLRRVRLRTMKPADTFRGVSESRAWRRLSRDRWRVSSASAWGRRAAGSP